MLNKKWLNRQEAADYLGYAYQTLANKAVDGSGPRFKRMSGKSTGGAVRYLVDDLDEFINSSGDVSSSSAGAKRGYQQLTPRTLPSPNITGPAS